MVSSMRGLASEPCGLVVTVGGGGGLSGEENLDFSVTSLVTGEASGRHTACSHSGTEGFTSGKGNKGQKHEPLSIDFFLKGRRE